MRMSSSIAHRGPEEDGCHRAFAGGMEVLLVHRRLKIIDLSLRASQPMQGDGGALSVVFNGEIYNFLELRRILEDTGAAFKSSSDTEVILAAYAYWGVDCISHLHGMFAFALWDSKRREIILARDRIGKKPLFYWSDGCTFIFGSEIKAILTALDRVPEVDPEAIDDYLTYLYIPYPRTIFRGIRQLPPATWMRVKLGEDPLRMETHTFWDPMNTGSHHIGSSLPVLESEMQDLIAESVRCRLIADVPLGVLLSGGIDSSSITAMMAHSSTQPVKSFSIGFPQSRTYNEIPWAKRVSEHFETDHTVLEAEHSCYRHLARIIWHFDQPFGNPTAVLAYILAALTKRSVTVALAGDGGDELFGGYPRYIGAYLSGLPRALPGFMRNGLLPWMANQMHDDTTGRHQFRRLREFCHDGGRPLIEMYLQWIGYFSPNAKQRLYSESFRTEVCNHDSGEFLRGLYRQSEGLEPLNRLAYVDIKSFLCCNVLEYADRMSMAHALELRAPFTDHRLVEFSTRVPFRYKFRYAESKWLLKRTMKPFLPDEVLRKRKLGFNPPVGQWLQSELKMLPDVLLSDRKVRQRGLFEQKEIRKLKEDQTQGRRDNSLHIWALVILELWFQIYMDGCSVDAVQEDIEDAVIAGPGNHATRIHAEGTRQVEV